MKITKRQLRRIIQEYSQLYVEPAGNVIGIVGADIDGDHRYYQELTVTHDPSTDEITIVVKDQGAAGGMDGPGGSTGFMLSGKQVLPAGAKGKDVVATIKDMIYQYADTIKRYGKPSKNFTWANSTYSRGPKGLNAKLATAALRKARGLEENKQLLEIGSPPDMNAPGWGPNDSEDWERQARAGRYRQAVREGQLDDAILMLDGLVSELDMMGGSTSPPSAYEMRKTVQKVIEVLRDVAEARK